MPKSYPFAARQQQSQAAKAANQAFFYAGAQARIQRTQALTPKPLFDWEKWSCRVAAFLLILMIPTILLGLWGIAHG